MSGLTRRQLLQRFAGCFTGTVVLAQTVLAEDKEASTAAPAAPNDLADRLAADLPADAGQCALFVNRGFVNGGGGFRNGGFRNGGGFANTGFRNGGFVNGGFRNGSFRNW